MDEWVKAGEIVPLRADEVQVWKLGVEQARAMRGACWAVLNEQERERAGRFVLERAREEFVAGRGFLRMLLGAAVGCAAAAVEFELGRHGKPRVEGVEFNVSHSRGLVVVALCGGGGGGVGVDVEWIDPDFEALEIAEASFAAEEIARLRVLTGLERVRLFYRMWTLKEAVAKAQGDGLTGSLASWVVPKGLTFGMPTELFFSGGEEGALGTRQRYFVHPFDPGEGFCGVLVVPKTGVAVFLHEVAGGTFFNKPQIPGV